MSHRQTHFPHGSPLSSAETKALRAAADHEESGGCGFRSGIRKRGRLPANDAIPRHAPGPPHSRLSLTLAIERLSATTTTACARALSSGAPARTTAPPRPVRILCPTKPAASSLRSPPTRPLLVAVARCDAPIVYSVAPHSTRSARHHPRVAAQKHASPQLRTPSPPD